MEKKEIVKRLQKIIDHTYDRWNNEPFETFNDIIGDILIDLSNLQEDIIG